MLQIRWTNAAITDFEEGVNYIGAKNPVAAERIALKVHQAVKRLQQMPNLGRVGRYEGLREWVISNTPYIIWYRVDEQRCLLEIIRVFHHARDLP